MCAALTIIGIAAPLAVSRDDSTQDADATPNVEILAVEGTSLSGFLEHAAPDGIRLRDKEGPTGTFKFEDLLRIEFPHAGSEAARRSHERVIHLASGGKLYGHVTGEADGGTRVNVPTLGGERSFSYESLAGIRMANTRHDQADQAFERELKEREPGRDVVILLRDGQVDSFKGVVEALGPQGGRFVVAGREVSLDPATLYAVVFAAGVGKPRQGLMTLELTTQEIMSGRIASSDGRHFTFDGVASEPVRLPWSLCRRIVVHTDRVVFLSDLEPTSFEHTPYLNVHWPLRRDRSVANQPIRLGGRTYGKGLGVHSASRITYSLNGEFKKFAAVIGIDDAVRPRGNVIFRVLADGRELFDSGPVTGRDAPKPVLVDIRGARRLSLLVEFGADADLGDHADWAWARVVRD